VQKSQHQPSRYFQDLLRKFDISERLVPELNSRYKAVQFWADKCRPDGRKSLPSYRKCQGCIYTATTQSPYLACFLLAAFILHKLLLQLKEPEEVAKVRIPTGTNVQQRLNKWWAELEPKCYYFEEQDGVCQSPRTGSS